MSQSGQARISYAVATNIPKYLSGLRQRRNLTHSHSCPLWSACSFCSRAFTQELKEQLLCGTTWTLSRGGKKEKMTAHVTALKAFAQK